MDSLGIGPVSRMNSGGGRHYGKPRRRPPERKDVISSPSYQVEQGAPIGAKKWLKSLFQAEAIHLTVDRIAELLGGRGKAEAVERQAAPPAQVSCGPTCQIFREAVALEESDAVVHEAEKPARQPIGYLVPLAVLAAVGAFLFTVIALDAVFGTHSLATLLSLVLP